MESPFTLFDHTSVNNDSPVFELDGQRTVVAVGMQPGPGKLKQLPPRHEGAAQNAVCLIILPLKKMLNRPPENMGAMQLQARKHA